MPRHYTVVRFWSVPMRAGYIAIWHQRLSGSGRIDEARQAFAEMLRSYPDLTISKFKQAMVFSGTTLDRMAENLRRLGLPD